MQCDRCGHESAVGMRFCGVCGAPLGETLALSPLDADGANAQRRQMTVMFADLVASTLLAERLDPEDFRDVLSGYHSVCARAVERLGGYVAQYQGDGVIAYFGYPRAHEDDARRAAHAALEILTEIATLNGRLRELFDVSLEVRIGVHTGLVVAGEMGTGHTRERHAAVGEPLHIAARLQTFAPPGSVVVSDFTLELIGDEFETKPLGARALKGISHAVGIHEVCAATADAGLEPLRSPAARPLVDRTQERARLGEAWQRASHGGGVLVHCSGDPGIGKSRLVQDLRELVLGAGAATHVLQCSPHHTSSVLHPAIRFLERRLDADGAATPELQLASLERCALNAALDASEAVPLLADLLSIPGARHAVDLTPRDARNALLRNLETLLLGDPAERLLLVVEDVHWADPTTVELLERIISRIEHSHVACVLTFRTEFQPPWTHLPDTVEIELGPLASADVRTMIAASTPSELDPDELARVESATEGVPMYVEEMVKALVLARSSASPSESRVPATLRGLLAERLDRLPELAGVIDVAAVVGREFERGLVEDLAALDRRTFASALARLTAEEIMRPIEGSRTRLEFKHVLLQEAAYDRLLHRRRRSLHERVAELLAAPSATYAGTEPERIAHHWSLAGAPAKALAYWELAGRRALKRAAFLEAAEHFRHAVEELDSADLRHGEGPVRGDLLTHLGAALQAGRSPAAADVAPVYAEARAAYERAGRREQLIPVIRGQCLYHVARADHENTLALALQMREMGAQDERQPWLSEGQFYLGFAHLLKGELESARTALEDASRLYRPDGHHDLIPEAHSDPGVAALAYLSSLLWHQGHATEAIEVSDRSLELAELVGGSVTLALAWGMHCALLLFRGRAGEFVSWVEKTRVHCVERNVGYWRTVCSIWSGWAQGHAGEPERAASSIRALLDAYLESGARVGAAHFFGLLADLELLAGERERALASLASGQAHIDSTGERYYEPDLQWYLARTLMTGAEPDLDAAVSAYERSITLAGEQGARLLQLRAAAALTRLQQKVGEPQTARALVESLSADFPPACDIPDVLYARGLLMREPAGR